MMFGLIQTEAPYFLSLFFYLICNFYVIMYFLM